MRESVFFEVTLRRFGVWRVALGAVPALAIATVVAGLAAMVGAQSASVRWLVVAVAAGLALATIAVAVTLARVEGGVLGCRDCPWTLVAAGGAVRAGAFSVAIDRGAFLRLRLGEDRRTSLLPPVPRRGPEREWHALRCAAYSPPPVGVAASVGGARAE